MQITQAEQMARALLEEFALPAGGWTFRFNATMRAFGRCHIDARLIELSTPLTLAGNAASTRKVLLHEIAHATAPRRSSHGLAWRARADALGIATGRWSGSCGRCGDRVVRFQRPTGDPYCPKHRRASAEPARLRRPLNDALDFGWLPKPVSPWRALDVEVVAVTLRDHALGQPGADYRGARTLQEGDLLPLIHADHLPASARSSIAASLTGLCVDRYFGTGQTAELDSAITLLREALEQLDPRAAGHDLVVRSLEDDLEFLRYAREEHALAC